MDIHTGFPEPLNVVLLTHVQRADGKPRGTETGRQRADFSPTPFECAVQLALKNVCKYASFHFRKVQICLCVSEGLHGAQPQRQSSSAIRPQRH